MQLTPEATMGILALFGITVLGILFVLNLLQHQTVEAHEKRLDEGKVIFGEIKADVGEIKADIKLIKFKLEIEDKGND